MKEMRQKVIEECTLKESAAINQILGRKVSIVEWKVVIGPNVLHIIRSGFVLVASRAVCMFLDFVPNKVKGRRCLPVRLG